MKRAVISVGLAAAGAAGFHQFAAKPSKLQLNTPYPIGEVGVPYSVLAVKGGKPPYKCLISSGSLPPGLALNAQCYITGTPTQASSGMLVAVR